MSDTSQTAVSLCFENMMKGHFPPVDPDGFNAVYPTEIILRINTAFKRAASSSCDNEEDGQPEEIVSEAWRHVDKNEILCPGYLLNIISGNSTNKTDPEKYKIDGSLILKTDEELVEEGVSNFFLDDLYITFKSHVLTEKDSLDDDARDAVDFECTGLIAGPERIFHFQHRAGLFVLYVNGGEFRVARWDRSGCITTEAINYIDSVEDTKKLLKFVYAYSKATPEQRGFDPTAIRLSKNSCGWQWMHKVAAENPLDVAYAHCTVIQSLPQGFVTKPTSDAPPSSLFATNVLTDDPTAYDGFGDLSSSDATSAITPVFKYVRDLFRKSLEKARLCYSLKVCRRDYLVGEPIFAPQGLIGWGTRGYVALEWKTQCLVFLKDAWRPVYEGVDHWEGTTLVTLNAANVSFVPTLVCHEDVGGCQETEASQCLFTGSKKRDVFGEEEKQSRPIAPLPRAHSQGSGSGASTTKRTRQSSGGSNGTPQAQTSSGSNGNRSVGQGSGGGSGKRSLPQDVAPVRPPDKDGLGLRHLTHYRIVVAEVCLPSTDIESAGQLLRVILHCMLAHRDAAVKCGMLHRDVSTGNILIRPVVVRVNLKTGEIGVLWFGLLSDWELAKPLPQDSTVGKARQPHRTGTWYYMFVHCLAHPEIPVSIADELESFLHVLIYLAIRFLRTSSLNVQIFVTNDFEGFVEDENHRLSCGVLKQMIIRNGSLTWNNKPVVFVSKSRATDRDTQRKTDVKHDSSPLNDVIATYLSYFKARYAVLDYEDLSATTNVTTPIPSLQSATDAAMSSEERGRQIELTGDLEMGIPDFTDSDLSTGQETGHTMPPESVYYERAAKLKTHDAIIGKLANAIRTKIWPSGDYAGDQLTGYTPSQLQPTAKRARLQMRSTMAFSSL